MPKTGLESTALQTKAITIALELVRRHGYEKFRLLDVAKEMQISHAALYNYFSSKDDLLDSINKQWLEQIDNNQQLLCDSDAPILERITQWSLNLYAAKRDKVRSDLEPYAAFLDATKQNRPYIQAHLHTQYVQLNGLVKTAVKEKLLVGNVDEITKLLLSAMHDFHHPAFVKLTATEDRTSELRYLLRVLFAGLSQE